MNIENLNRILNEREQDLLKREQLLQIESNLDQLEPSKIIQEFEFESMEIQHLDQLTRTVQLNRHLLDKHSHELDWNLVWTHQKLDQD